MNYEGLNALIYALDRPDIAELLIRKGTPLDTKNRFGDFVLLRAASYSHHAVVALMLQYGLDVTGDDGASALQSAMPHKDGIICRLLIQHQAGIHSSQSIYIL